MILYKAVTNVSASVYKIKYVVGKTYKLTGSPSLSMHDFTFSKSYRTLSFKITLFSDNTIDRQTKILEVEPLVKVPDTNVVRCVDHFKVVREIPRSEWEGYKFDLNDNLIYWESLDGSLWEKSEYDKDNNLLRREFENGLVEDFTYDKNGNLILCESSAGFFTKYEYDGNNNLKHFENSHGYFIDIQYDERDNEIYSKSSFKAWRKCEYDENNNLIRTETSSGQIEEFEYDDNNNLIKHIKNGKERNFKYDKNNNVISQEWVNGKLAWIKSDYDEDDNLIYQESSDGTTYNLEIS